MSDLDPSQCEFCGNTIHVGHRRGCITMPGGTGRRPGDTTAQAVQVATGGAPPPTPEGNGALRHVAREALARLVMNSNGEQFGRNLADRIIAKAVDEWRRVVLVEREDGTFSPPTAAEVEADQPSAASAASAPEGIDAQRTPLERQQHLALTYVGGLLQNTKAGWRLRGSDEDVWLAWRKANAALMAYHEAPPQADAKVESAATQPTPEGFRAECDRMSAVLAAIFAQTECTCIDNVDAEQAGDGSWGGTASQCVHCLATPPYAYPQAQARTPSAASAASAPEGLTSPANTNREPTQEEAEIAIRAYDAGLFMQRDHVRSGIIDHAIARIFAMMDALRAVDDVRRTGTATIHCDEKDPAYRAAKEQRDAAN